MSFQDLIDQFILTFFSGQTSDTDDQARVIEYMQQAERELCMMQNWWFMEQELTFSYLAGTREYSINSSYKDVIAMFDGNGVRLKLADDRTYMNTFRGDAASDTQPKVWTRLSPERSGSTQGTMLHVWPNLINAVNGKYVVITRPAVWTYVSTSYPKVPQEYRPYLIIRAAELMSQDDARVEVAGTMKATKDELLSTLVADHQRRKA